MQRVRYFAFVSFHPSIHSLVFRNIAAHGICMSLAPFFLFSSLLRHRYFGGLLAMWSRHQTNQPINPIYILYECKYSLYTPPPPSPLHSLTHSLSLPSKKETLASLPPYYLFVWRGLVSFDRLFVVFFSREREKKLNREGEG